MNCAHSMHSRATDSLQGCTQGFGWAIAKALAEAGAEISLGVWVCTLAAALCVLHCLAEPQVLRRPPVRCRR